MASMTMSSMTMPMSSMTAPMSTTSAAMAMSTTGSMGSMGGMSGMGGMDSMGGMSCKISMTWNWYTVGACFISKSWQITSPGMFAGSCIGVICLVISLEFLRRISREVDTLVTRHHMKHSPLLPMSNSTSSTERSASDDAKVNDLKGERYSTRLVERSRVEDPAKGDLPKRVLLVQQIIRSVIYAIQFAVAYFIMLLAMYYNGYIIICIIIGAFLGSFIFSRDQLRGSQFLSDRPPGVTACCV